MKKGILLFLVTLSFQDCFGAAAAGAREVDEYAILVTLQSLQASQLVRAPVDVSALNPPPLWLKRREPTGNHSRLKEWTSGDLLFLVGDPAARQVILAALMNDVFLGRKEERCLPREGKTFYYSAISIDNKCIDHSQGFSVTSEDMRVVLGVLADQKRAEKMYEESKSKEGSYSATRCVQETFARDLERHLDTRSLQEAGLRLPESLDFILRDITRDSLSAS